MTTSRSVIVVTCVRCGEPLKDRLYLPTKQRHVACPTPREIAQDRRMGRRP